MKVHAIVTPFKDDLCLPWQMRNRTTGICECVSGDVQGIVRRRNEPYDSWPFAYYTDINQSHVGSRQYNCERESKEHFFDITVDNSIRMALQNFPVCRKVCQYCVTL